MLRFANRLVHLFCHLVLLCVVFRDAWAWFITPACGIAAPPMLALWAASVMWQIFARGLPTPERVLHDEALEEAVKRDPERLLRHLVMLPLLTLALWGILYAVSAIAY